MIDRGGLIDDMLAHIQEIGVDLDAFEQEEGEDSDVDNEARISSIRTELLGLEGTIGDLVP